MKYDEFFKAMREQETVTAGERRAFWAWNNSKDFGLNEIEMNDILFENEVHDFIETFKKADVQSFVLTDQSTALMKNIHAFNDEGYRIDGPCTIKRQRPYQKTPEEIQGIRFIRN